MFKQIFLFCILMMGQSLLYTQTIQEISFKKRDFLYELSLPYHCNEKPTRIFTEDTTLAINIKEFFIDGKQIFPEGGSILAEFIPVMKIRRTRRNQNVFYITTRWLPGYKNEARCIEWMDLSSGYSYKILEGSKIVLIHYNVILPFPSANVEKLIHRQIPEGFYTEDYWVRVNLDNDFIL